MATPSKRRKTAIPAADAEALLREALKFQDESAQRALLLAEQCMARGVNLQRAIDRLRATQRRIVA